MRVCVGASGRICSACASIWGECFGALPPVRGEPLEWVQVAGSLRSGRASRSGRAFAPSEFEPGTDIGCDGAVGARGAGDAFGLGWADPHGAGERRAGPSSFDLDDHRDSAAPRTVGWAARLPGDLVDVDIPSHDRHLDLGRPEPKEHLPGGLSGISCVGRA